MARGSLPSHHICYILPRPRWRSWPSAPGRSVGASTDPTQESPVQFLSDNTSTACPEILAALAQVNQGRVHSYGADEWTQRLERLLGEYFGTAVKSFVVATGTAANSLSL